MATELAVAAAGLGHAYRPGRWLFRQISIQLPVGGALAILGPNGRGKSTLLRCLSGLASPLEGTSSLKIPLALVPASAQVEFSYSAFQMVLMGRARAIGLFSQPTARDEKIARDALTRLGIQHLSARAWDTLSGGERQLVLMCRAIASEARLWFLDEPTASLDPHNQARVVHWLQKLIREDHLSLVLTTHDPNQAYSIASQTLLLFESAQHRIGATAEVLTEQALSELFACTIRRVLSDAGGRLATHFVTEFPL